MNWQYIESEAALEKMLLQSEKNICILFKHSRRCIISIRVLKAFERQWSQEASESTISFYFLDLISFRGISNEIAERLNVRHESPQVLVIQDRNCLYHTSHGDILHPQLEERVMAFRPT